MADLETVSGTADDAGVIRDSISISSTDNSSLLHGCMWHVPGQTSRGVLHIIHGMCEFAERYDAFARYLAQQGYLVVAHDQIGHGASVSSKKDWGHFEPGQGARVLIEDVHRIRQALTPKYPDLPWFVMGHSMGSFVARNYMQEYSEGLSGVILSGTGSFPLNQIKFVYNLSSVLIALRGSRAKTAFFDRMAIAGYARKFPEDGPAGWITRNKAVREAYLKEPRCNFRFDLGGYHEVLHLMRRSEEDRLITRSTKRLPILIISGDKDPVGQYGAGPRRLYNTLKRLSFSDAELKLYPGARHELINEINADEVFTDIFDWLERHSY